jgi:dTDP-4-dehydrorhamnose reductase
MKTILVTGSNGQMGLLSQSLNYQNHNFIYTNRKTLDISNSQNIEYIFEKFSPDYCINFAAHVLADKAEIEEKEKAYLSNYSGPKELAKVCNKFNTILIHFSSDYVFGGENKITPYTEADTTSPLSLYGKTKADCELELFLLNSNTYVIRTSWIYSNHGRNFVSMIKNLIEFKDCVNVVYDQVGTPTNGYKLFEVICQIIDDNDPFGIYNYSSEGVTSWYDFAIEIADHFNLSSKVHPILSKDYPFIAKRPSYSVLDKQKIKDTLKIEIQNWRIELKQFLNRYY